MITRDELDRRLESARSMTAAELVDLLNSCPEWVRQNADREARHRSEVEKTQREVKPEEDPLLLDLARAGCRVGSVWDLVNTSASYPDAILVLLKYLPLARHPVLRNGIARALTVKEARGIAAGPILRELKKPSEDTEVRWALAHALTVVAEKKDAEEIKSLINDRHYEDVRERLEKALKTALRGRSRVRKV
jgi:hypothetical protein